MLQKSNFFLLFIIFTSFHRSTSVAEITTTTTSSTPAATRPRSERLSSISDELDNLLDDLGEDEKKADNGNDDVGEDDILLELDELINS